ncbi:purine-binding chemotaxis protein CheW [Dissulfurirhabdus thermomarina]|uniref:Purine-binding chemotaxis protein CheW n=1 Tax=Dissulfurirhabdus thermomarina TaxID=1765737 RepID=A0A6N9TMD8_DISTH|nr:chemotaxis protein CheW [Dissulfurirhabdus thermomarina]NDY42405.1 purine-binding chemotaxis protein CheW [Dissulfurirhabdus thermomarina]NMX23225.1 purine-binding chemotaxis protein CheW [Dissulfurirhabdus thermomarina]
MLHILFHQDGDAYALPVDRVVEVVPMVHLRRLPGAPREVAGLANYRGRVIPVLDLCAVLAGRPCRPLASTRILVVRLPDPGGGERLAGLLAEGVTGTLQADEARFVEPGVHLDGAPYLGKVAAGESMVQVIEVDGLLPDELRRILFREAAEAAAE